MKDTPNFDFLPEIPMDRGHQLDQSTSRFRSVRDGLPELVKNAKDQYARLKVIDRAKRQIVVMADTVKATIAVLDFAGAQAKDFGGWMTWSSRTAHKRHLAHDIEGGHGNGGKAFMVRGSDAYAFMESCANGKRTRMGFNNADNGKRYLPGYGAENGSIVRDREERNPRQRLNELLRLVGMTEDMLPTEALDAFVERKAFTMALVAGVRDWTEKKRRGSVSRHAADIPSQLRTHPQAALTLETSSVWVFVDGRCVTNDVLEIQYPAPFDGFEDLDPIPVPQDLPDPVDGEMVDTGPGGPDDKYLLLRTSDKQLRMTDEGKAVNVIRVRNDRTIVANWSLAELLPRAPSGFILGELRVPVLEGEYLEDSHRSSLADTPLKRALEAWSVEQAGVLADRIQKAQANETRDEERSSANNALQEFRKLMRAYLHSDDISGPEGTHAGDGSGSGDSPGTTPPPPPPRPRGELVDQVILEQGRDVMALAVGTSVPLIARCYETQESGEKRSVPGVELDLHSEPPDVVKLIGDCQLAADSEGLTEIWMTDPQTGVESNRVLVETVQAIDVDVVGPDEILKQGQRVKLLISFQTEKGRRDDLFVEGWVDETDLGRISRTGAFTAGMMQGTATVRVRYGPGSGDVGLTTIEIGFEVQPRGTSGDKGGDVPHILLCGVTAPGMDEYPEDQRTHTGGDRYPTIIEEPHFQQVVWINHSSKESLRVRQSRGGSSGVGRIDSKTFRHFLALKCFEILKRLKVRQAIADREVPEREFTRELAQAEMDCVGFVDAAYELADRLQVLEAQE